MLKHNPLPRARYQLPHQLKLKRDALEREDSSKKLVVCIYGYSKFVKLVLDSLKEDPQLEVHLATKSIIERQRAENDGYVVVRAAEVLGRVDFWLCITPYDKETDFRNSTEENLEYVTVPEPIFSKRELLLLKDECYIANMCTYMDALGLAETLETDEDAKVQFALFPRDINALARITYHRRIKNDIARRLHKVIRRKLKLEKDHDPRTG